VILLQGCFLYSPCLLIYLGFPHTADLPPLCLPTPSLLLPSSFIYYACAITYALYTGTCLVLSLGLPLNLPGATMPYSLLVGNCFYRSLLLCVLYTSNMSFSFFCAWSAVLPLPACLSYICVPSPNLEQILVWTLPVAFCKHFMCASFYTHIPLCILPVPRPATS
jgi:hypothetical protein